VQHPSSGLVRNFTNEAGPEVSPGLYTTSSHTSLGECPTPYDYRFWLMDIELAFDVAGNVYNDYPPYGRNRVGHLRKAP